MGELTETIISKNKDGTPIVSSYGQFGVMLEWSWRIERPQSIYFGSFSSDRIIDNRLPDLQHGTVEAVEFEGRLPELVIRLSNGLWVHSFSTTEGQPQWCLFLDRKQRPHAWLISERGRLIKETKRI